MAQAAVINCIQNSLVIGTASAALTDSLTTGTAAPVVYGVLTSAAMDGQAAVWRKISPQHPGGYPMSPTFSLTTRSNGPKTARRTAMQFRYPFGYQEFSGSVATGIWKKVGEIVCNENGWVVPNNAPSSLVAQAQLEYAALVCSDMTRGTMQSGYSPN